MFTKTKRKSKKKKKLIHNITDITPPSNIPLKPPTTNDTPTTNDDSKKRKIEIDNESFQKLKRRKLNTNYQQHTNKKSYNDIHKIESDKKIESQSQNLAAVQVYKDTPKPKSLIELGSDTTLDGHIRYRGLKNYKGPQKKAPKFLGIGPQRAPDNIKITCYTDYEPNICKDWKETGYCGYGASCKFLHDRTDYKMGWEIDKDYNKINENINNAKKNGLKYNNNNIENNQYIISDDEYNNDEYPMKCFICKNDFVNPVKTQCNHYFCSECAMERFRKRKSCACCGDNTDGVFMKAVQLIKYLKRNKLNNVYCPF